MARLIYVMWDAGSPAASPRFRIASQFIVEYFGRNPQDQLDVIDLQTDCIPIDHDVMSACEKIRKGSPSEALTEQERQKLSRIKRVTGNFIAADKYVFVTPDWNAALPAEFNEYVASLCAFGKFFKMLPGSPINLIRKRSKKCIHIYSTAGPGAGKEESSPMAYFRFVMDSLGISQVETIAVEDTGLPTEQSVKAVMRAEREVMRKVTGF